MKSLVVDANGGLDQKLLDEYIRKNPAHEIWGHSKSAQNISLLNHYLIKFYSVQRYFAMMQTDPWIENCEYIPEGFFSMEQMRFQENTAKYRMTWTFIHHIIRIHNTAANDSPELQIGCPEYPPFVGDLIGLFRYSETLGEWLVNQEHPYAPKLKYNRHNLGAVE